MERIEHGLQRLECGRFVDVKPERECGLNLKQQVRVVVSDRMKKKGET